MPLTLRGWATPLLMGVFVLMAGSGVVMFFKFDNGIMAPSHRIFSWLFLIGAAGHITANIRPLQNHLKSAWGKLNAIAFCSILLISFYSWGRVTTPKLYSAMELEFLSAPMTAVASMRQESLENLLAILRQQGIPASGDESIKQIAAANHLSEKRVLDLVLLDLRNPK